MTGALTLLSSWQICFLEAMWRLWLWKSSKNLLGVSGAMTKEFVGVYQAVQKPQCGLKARACAYIWLKWVQHGSCLATGIFIMIWQWGNILKGKSQQKKSKQATVFLPNDSAGCLWEYFYGRFLFLYVTASYHFITWVFKKGLYKFAFWTYTATLFIWATVTGLLINVNRLFSFYF